MFSLLDMLDYDWDILVSFLEYIFIWSDCNWTRTQNHLLLKRTLNHLAKLAFFLNLDTTFKNLISFYKLK